MAKAVKKKEEKKPKKKSVKLNVYMLVDRSGSMLALWSEAIGSINTYVDKLKKNSHIHVDFFDDASYDNLRNQDKKDWKPLDVNEIMPRGFTPLNDSIGKIVNKVLADKPEAAVIVIMTDGAENNSREYTAKQVKELLKKAEEAGYPSVFLGANFDAIEAVGKGYGMQVNRTVSTSSHNLGQTMSSLAAKTEQYRNLRASGQSFASAAATMEWSDQEKEEAKK